MECRGKNARHLVFFRNDDPDFFQRGDKRRVLTALVEVFLEESAHLTLAAIPQGLTDSTCQLIHDAAATGMLGVIQHGFRHARYQTGEFDFTRTLAQQRQDIRAGWQLLTDRLGPSILTKAFTAPYGAYARATYRALSSEGFIGISSSLRTGWTRRWVHTLARRCRLQFLGKKRVPYHLAVIPRTGLYEVSTAVNVLAPKGGMKALSDILSEVTTACSSAHGVVGILLHHIHMSMNDVQACRRLIQALRSKGWQIGSLTTLLTDGE